MTEQTTGTYNLLDEHWIPCEALDGTSKKLGIREMLMQAHEIREISVPSPLASVSIHRVLLCLLHRVLGPATQAEWQAIENENRFSSPRLGGSLTEYMETMHDRFFLFDGPHPFFQDLNITSFEVPVARLMIEIASGNNTTLFDHGGSSFPAAEVASALIAHQAYAIGFGNASKRWDNKIKWRLTDGSLTRGRGFVLLVEGQDLFHTLVYNMTLYNDQEPFPRTSDDKPIWERDAWTQPNVAGNHPAGYLELLTWPSRAIRLLSEAEECCSWMGYFQHYSLPKEFRPDPMKPYTDAVAPTLGKGKKVKKSAGALKSKSPFKEFQPIAGKDAWRDYYAFFGYSKTATNHAPKIFNVLANATLSNMKSGETPVWGLHAYGFGTRPGKARSVMFWVHDRLPFSVDYARSQALVDRLEVAINLANEIGKLFSPFPGSPVFTFIESWFSSVRKARKPEDPLDDYKHTGASLGLDREYWSRMESIYLTFVTDLPCDVVDAQGLPGKESYPRFVDATCDCAKDVFDAFIRDTVHDPTLMKSAVEAGRRFDDKIKAIRSQALKR